MKKQNKILNVVLMLVLVFVHCISLFRFGIIGAGIDNIVQLLIGYSKFVYYVFMIVCCVYYVWKLQFMPFTKKWWAMILVSIATSLLFITISTSKSGWGAVDLFNATFGILYNLLFAVFSSLIGHFGIILFVIFLYAIALVLYFGKEKIAFQYAQTKHSIVNYQENQKIKKENEIRKIPTFDLRKAKKHSDVFITLDDTPIKPTSFETITDTKKTTKFIVPIIEDTEKEQLVEQSNITEEKNVKPKSYDLPKLNLLKESTQKANIVNQKKAEENSHKIIDVLEQFQIQATVTNISIGPTVTRFEIRPEQGVRINRIATLQHDIKMALAAKHLRIEAPIPGKSAVGIEIPNVEKEMVYMKEVFQSIKNTKSKLLFVLGKDLTGNSVYGELNKMPHLLVAGSTGSGKSVCINSIITSILLRSTPEEVRILLIDPKKVEFTPYKNIPHLVTPIITDANKASRALEVIVSEMDRRYDVFAECGVRNLEAYYELQKTHKDLESMPYIMVVIDELADLMLVASKKVESSIQRITQLARAAGIHLIVATQRPSVDVITGVIKSNIPSRIAFAVSSSVDSRTILDESGAEKLLGYGDMLYVPIGEQNLIRVQGVYVSDEEVESICRHTEKYGEPIYMEVFEQLEQLDNHMDNGPSLNDDLYFEVKAYVIKVGKASASDIQGRFGIGYPRANKLMHMLEKNGVIGPKDGGKSRKVLLEE